MTASRIRWADLALSYAAFYVWYGGHGDPLTAQETQRFLEIAESRKPAVSCMVRELSASDDGNEFVMVNLNAYREKPEYADGREPNGSSEEIETRYTSKMVPRLLARACHPLVVVAPITQFTSGGGNRFPSTVPRWSDTGADATFWKSSC
jgi:hypothetical protein